MSDAIRAEAEREAEKLVDYFLVNGMGEKGVRLVITGPGGEDFGGWGRGPIVLKLTESIEAALRGRGEKLRREEEAHAALQVRCFEGFPSATDGVFDALRASEARERKLREALVAVLGSAHPHPRENPSMAMAWAFAREALDEKGEGNG